MTDELKDDDVITLDQFEHEHGWMLKDAKADTSKKMKRSEFLAMIDDPKVEWVGIHHESREAWLEANGYKPTRANMLNTALTSKAKSV